jgi:MFS family permease
VSALLPGYLLMGIGMAFAFIPMSIAALAGVEEHEAGLASGLINTSQQIGGALGVAVAATVAFTHMDTLLQSGHSPAEAQTSGFALAFWVLAGISAASVVACLALVRGGELETATAEADTCRRRSSENLPGRVGFEAHPARDPVKAVSVAYPSGRCPASTRLSSSSSAQRRSCASTSSPRAAARRFSRSSSI